MPGDRSMVSWRQRKFSSPLGPSCAPDSLSVQSRGLLPLRKVKETVFPPKIHHRYRTELGFHGEKGRNTEKDLPPRIRHICLILRHYRENEASANKHHQSTTGRGTRAWSQAPSVAQTYTN